MKPGFEEICADILSSIMIVAPLPDPNRHRRFVCSFYPLLYHHIGTPPGFLGLITILSDCGDWKPGASKAGQSHNGLRWLLDARRCLSSGFMSDIAISASGGKGLGRAAGCGSG
jgi:hypothetical protein